MQDGGKSQHGGYFAAERVCDAYGNLDFKYKAVRNILRYQMRLLLISKRFGL
jgi:hypothetical protein